MISLKLIIVLASLAPVAPPQLTAGVTLSGNSPISADVADLQDQLEAGLRARRPREFVFIARVVNLVEQNTLPMKLVRETFDWAREKKPYPFPYFERALRLRAAKIGVQI